MEPITKAELYHRQHTGKICVWDIDGVLTNYPNCWVQYVNLVGHEISGFKAAYGDFTDLNHMKSVLPYKLYRQLKNMYRESNYKANLPIDRTAIPVMNQLKEQGYKNIIMTARPVDEFPALQKITIDWLYMHGVPFDNLIFSKKKQFDIITKYPTAEFFVDDNRKTSNLIAKFGFKVYLRNNYYNQGEVLESVQRINSLTEIIEAQI